MRTLTAAAILCIAVAAGVWWAVLTMVTPPQASAAARGVERMATVDPPQPAPPLSFIDGEGRLRSLKDFAGKTVLLNVWATWCAPCVTEMPALDRLQGLLGGRDFEVLALSVDRGGRATVAPFFEKTGLKNLSVYLDPPGTAMGALALRGLPTTLLIDGDGNIRARMEGPAEWDGPEALKLLRPFVERRGPARGQSSAS